jgi:hypothetical protein
VNLQSLRDYIRMQLDMDEEELPNPMLDAYIIEGYTRMMSMENRWPSFQQRWEVIRPEGALEVPLPPDCDPSGLSAVVDDRGMRLVQVAPEQAEDQFNAHAVATAAPAYYTLWGGVMQLWPSAAGAERTLYLRGYRLPSSWWLSGASAEVDADPRLHILLAHYAIALSYAQQEDEILEELYMKRFAAGFAAARNAICNPRHHRPLIYAGGLPYGDTGVTNAVWSDPPVSPDA